MDKFKAWLQKLLTGRYGSDQLSVFLTVLGTIALVAASVFQASIAMDILILIALVAISFALIRICSKDIKKRTQENQKFLTLFHRPPNAEKEQKKRQKAFIKEKEKTHMLFHCPECHSDCWVPKNKGKVRITCPKCGNKFLGKT